MDFPRNFSLEEERVKQRRRLREKHLYPLLLLHSSRNTLLVASGFTLTPAVTPIGTPIANSNSIFRGVSSSCLLLLLIQQPSFLLESHTRHIQEFVLIVYPCLVNQLVNWYRQRDLTTSSVNDEGLEFITWKTGKRRI